MKNPKDRMKYARKLLNLTIRGLAAEIQINQSAVGLIETGRMALTQRIADLVEKQFAIRAEWLLNGKGPTWIAFPPDQKLQSLKTFKEAADSTLKTSSKRPLNRGEIVWLAEKLCHLWDMAPTATSAWLRNLINASNQLSRLKVINNEYVTSEIQKVLGVHDPSIPIHSMLREKDQALVHGPRLSSPALAGAIARVFYILASETVFDGFGEFPDGLRSDLTNILMPWAAFVTRGGGAVQDSSGIRHWVEVDTSLLSQPRPTSRLEQRSGQFGARVQLSPDLQVAIRAPGGVNLSLRAHDLYFLNKALGEAQSFEWGLYPSTEKDADYALKHGPIEIAMQESDLRDLETLIHGLLANPSVQIAMTHDVVSTYGAA
ncbi:MAG: helix-turn-helix domain-containing protein [Nitrospinota bacterium]|nr:helix-turn-helix domain-containing protein [Nitrospinota bacterium]